MNKKNNTEQNQVEKEQSQVEKKYIVGQKLMSAISIYLQHQTYKDVYVLMAAMQQVDEYIEPKNEETKE